MTTNGNGGRERRGRRGNNEGSIYEVKTGRMAGTWRGYALLPDGSRKYVTGEMREEVAKKVAKLVVQAEAGGYVKTDDRTTVRVYLDHWLQHARRTTRPRTYAFYESYVRNYLVPRLGSRRLNQLTPVDVEAMLTWMTGMKGLSPGTARHALVTLRVALNRARKWGLIAHNAAALTDPPKQDEAPIEPFTVEQAQSLLAAAEGAQPGGHRLHALLALALATGLRAGELLGLRWDDVDLKRGTLTVRHALEAVSKQRRADPIEKLTADERRQGWRLVAPKSGASRRTLPLIPLAREALAAQRARVLEARLHALQRGAAWADYGAGGFVFPSAAGTPLGYRNAFREYQALLATAGLPPKRLHDLRHTTASFLLASGADLRVIQAVLGHAQISLTANLYTHLSVAMLGEAAGKLETLFRPAKAPGG